MAALQPVHIEQTPTDRTILQVIAIARWAIWGWLAITTLLQREHLDQRFVAIAAVVLALGWSAMCTVLLTKRPTMLVAPWFIVIEISIAWGLLLIDGWVFTPGHSFGSGQNLAGNWPLVSAISAATALGPYWGTALGLVAATGRYFGARANGVRAYDNDRVLSLVSSAVLYTVAAMVFGALAARLRKVENEVALSLARDEVARTLHDGVLQTLSLVDRRTRQSDPELASVARASDRELRAWLFHDVRDSDEGGRLEDRLRRAVDRVARMHDLDVSVSVLDDPDRPANPTLDAAVAAAVVEALNNVAKHASVAKAVVFADCDGDTMLVTVRDDGVGFDPVTVTRGRGLNDSIVKRLQDVGVDVEIKSALGQGTEIRMTTTHER